MRGRAIAYSDAEMEWLAANRTMIISDYHRAFVEAFQRPDVSALNLHGLRKRLGWKTGREGDRYKGRHRKFSAAEMAWLKANHLLPIADYHRAFVEAFPREDVQARNLHALRKRMGWRTGRTGQFAKGNVSHNKGKPCPEGVGGRHPNARKSQFQKGSRTGRAALNYQPIGTERLSQDGYLERKVHDGMPMQSRWRLVHLVEWEAVNGPVPEGLCLKCLDGDRRNTDPLNWVAIPRGVLPRLNGGKATRVMAYDAAPPALKPTLLAIAQVEHRASTLQRPTQAQRTDREKLAGAPQQSGGVSADG